MQLGALLKVATSTWNVLFPPMTQRGNFFAKQHGSINGSATPYLTPTALRQPSTM